MSSDKPVKVELKTGLISRGPETYVKLNGVEVACKNITISAAHDDVTTVELELLSDDAIAEVEAFVTVVKREYHYPNTMPVDTVISRPTAEGADPGPPTMDQFEKGPKRKVRDDPQG